MCNLCFTKRKIIWEKLVSENKKRLKPIRQKWWEAHRERAVEYQQKYRKLTEKYQRTLEKGRENARRFSKEWTKKNQKKILEKKYKRLKEDYVFKLKETVRSRIQSGLRQLVKNQKKSMRTIMYLGCTFDEYKIFLEKKFKENMKWSNMGGKNGWHIDHIKPLASFDLSKKTEQLKAFNYKNTQPLFKIDNLKKGAREVYPI